MKPDRDDESSRIIRNLAAGLFVVSEHARHRMNERGVEDPDLVEAGRTASSWTWQEDRETYRINGKDLDAEDLIVVCAWDGETVIVTVF